MRLLVVGHPFAVAHSQKKYVAMKQLEPGLELRVVLPRVYRRPFRHFPCEVHPELSSEEVVPLSFAFYQTHMTYLLDPLGLARVLRRFRPDVVHLEEEPHALITAETISLLGIFAPQAAVSLFTWDNLDRPRRFPAHGLKRCLRAYSLRRAPAVVCGNRDAEQILRTRVGYAGITEVLPQYGLAPPEHEPGRELALREQLGLDEATCVGYAGRMLREKGIGLLLEALAHLESLPWKLLLVGSGPMDAEIHEQWMPRFPRRIVHVPAVSYQDAPRYLRCLDIFVLGSYGVENWKEQFGLTLAQAMMLGVASVGSSSGAIPEVLGPGGLIFPEKNVNALRQALESLLDSAALRCRLGACAREFALERYALPQVAKKYLAVFERVQRARGTLPITLRPPTVATREAQRQHSP